ncbi:MAG: methyltransferase domain-containing protein [bacterium]
MNSLLAHRFSTAATTYEPADVQARVAARLAGWIGARLAARPPATILDVGCGTGLLTRALREKFPAAWLVASDLAEGMVRRTCAHFADDKRFEGVVADGTNPPFRHPFALVASSAALHWMTPLDAGLRGVATAVAPGGVLAAAVMVKGTLSELRAARQAVTPDCPAKSELPTESAVSNAVANSGLTLVTVESETREAHYPDGTACLHALHAQGVTGGPVSAGARLLTRGELRRIAAWLDCNKPHPDGGVRATYKVVYVWAERSS